MLDKDQSDTPTEGQEAPSNRDTAPADTPEAPTHDTPGPDSDSGDQKPARKTAAKKTAKKAPARKRAAKKTAPPAKDQVETLPGADDQAAVTDVAVDAPAAEVPAEEPAAEKPKKKAASRKRATKPAAGETPAASETDAEPAPETSPGTSPESDTESDTGDSAPAAPMVLFKAPETKTAPARKRTAKKASATPPADSEDAADRESSPAEQKPDATAEAKDTSGGADTSETAEDDSPEGEGGPRRRRRRGGRRRRKPSDTDANDDAGDDGSQDGSQDGSEDGDDSEDSDSEGGGSRRRRRRRRSGDDSDGAEDSDSGRSGGNGGGGGNNRARKQRSPEDEITSVSGSTRLEAKKQRRREGREAGRRRAPIVSEAEFLARREAVDRVMVIRQKDDLTQIGVLEDKVLVEHYVARESQTSLIGNVYLGRVQNVLPSMEAAFIDIGKGRNAVLYAGEVNWSALGHKDGQPRKIESVLSSGQTILVQVTKDPVGHKGARLTGQVSLPGRFLVYVPEGSTSGISRKLPDTERNRLKTLLKKIVPEQAGVIVRTAAEGASEEELTLDVERLTARWADIEEKVKAGKSPQLLYGEPDLTLKVVRDLFTEDFAKLVVQGDDAWDLVDGYVSHVAPDLRDRLERFDPTDSTGSGQEGQDLFAAYRVDEQIAKGLDRKVWLPSGGSLVIDRTEAMTVVDVNTGKFTGSGGNLEETVTKNNLEAAEEIVRQLRLRDIGGIIVVDFIDMVLESNRDLVLRRLVECLGRDRTRHQVAEVTSLGLVQMTRKRIGTGLLEAFSSDCEHCKGRGLVVHDHPVEPNGRSEEDDQRGRRSRGGRNRGRGGDGGGNRASGAPSAPPVPTPADLANSRPPEKPTEEPATQEAQSDDAQSEKAQPEKTQPEKTQPEKTQSENSQPDKAQPEKEVQSEGTQDEAASAEPEDQRAEPVVEKGMMGRPSGPAPEPQQVPTESSATGGDPEGADSGAEPEAAPAPRAVTTTRRRTARRPAGPPVATSPPPVAEEPAQQDGAVPGSGDEEETDGQEQAEDDDNGNGFSLLHVPIKRKRSRKR